jgi:hypothetical protein
MPPWRRDLPVERTSWQPGGVPFPPLLFAAHGDRGQAWADALRRDKAIELLAAVDLSAGGVEGLEEALDARPGAAVAVWASGPREATRLAERLVEHRGPALLHPAPARPPPGAGLQLTHGWLSLSGLGALERLFASRAVESVRLHIGGVPEGAADGLGPALYHAATLAQRLGRAVRVDRATLPNERELRLTLAVDEVPWRVEVGTRGPRLELFVRTAEGDYAWSADAIGESLQRPRAEPRAIPARPWAERCLAQLRAPVKGADLADARAARSLVDQVELSLERRLPPERPARQPAAPGLLGLGLLGEPPDAAPLAPTAPPAAELPFDALAYRLGLRPAVLLTVAPERAEALRGALEGHVIRREAREPGTDPRAPARVHLVAARDAAVAERLGALLEEEPAARLAPMGALLGYPACCVQAFGAQGHADETHTRYAIAARTAVGPGPWPALLDDTALALLPHSVCTYRCERSREQAEALLAALADERPSPRDAVAGYLGGPVLYFDRDHQLRFDGVVADGLAVRYRAVAIPRSPSEPFARLAGAVALGDRIALTDGALSVYRDGRRLFVLERTDPGLGVLLPFARRG